MKKYFTLIFIIPIVLFLLSFRNISIFTIDEFPLVKADSLFLGSWKIAEDTDQFGKLVISHSGEYQYKITYITGKGTVRDLSQNQAFISEIDSVKILNISYNKDNIKGYLLFKLSDIDTVKNTFIASIVKDTTLDLYDSRQGIREFVRNNLNKPEFFGSPVHLQKIKQ